MGISNGMIDLSEYKYRIEGHAHTSPVSPCGKKTPEETLEAYASIGFDAVTLTNHFIPSLHPSTASEYAKHFESDYLAARAAGERLGVEVLFGMELRFCEIPGDCNDYLYYGVDPSEAEEIYYYYERGLEAFYKEYRLRHERSLLIQAHPFRKNITRADLRFIDGIETFNMHPGHNSAIGFAAAYAREHDLIVTAGTDYHHEGHHGLCAVRTKTLPRDSFEYAEILRSRDYLFDLSGSIVVPYGYRAYE